MANNIIIQIPQTVITANFTDREKHLIKYPGKYPQRFTRLYKNLKDGYMSESLSAEDARIPRSSYNKIKSGGSALFEYCESNGIDWEQTDAYDIIDAYLKINEAYVAGFVNRNKLIEMAAYDKEDNEGRVTKKGDWKALKYLNEIARTKEVILEQETQKENRVQPLVIINVPDNIHQLAIISQQNLMKYGDEQ